MKSVVVSICFLAFCSVSAFSQASMINLRGGVNTERDEFLPRVYKNDLFFRRALPGFNEGYEVYSTKFTELEKESTNPKLLKTEKKVNGDINLSDFLSYNDLPEYSYKYVYSGKGFINKPKDVHKAINSEYNELHPAVSPDGAFIVFASDRPGGIDNAEGGANTDLYIIFRREDGSWTQAQNLGAPINTKFNEIAPFIGEEGDLYYSSAGFSKASTSSAENLNYDIIRAKVANSSGEWSSPKPLASPINTKFNEIGYVKINGTVIVSSNRRPGRTKKSFGGYDLWGGVGYSFGDLGKAERDFDISKSASITK